MKRAILISVLLAGNLLAQNGSISGIVDDPDGSIVANASVQAKDSRTGSVYTGVSSSTGKYSIAGLPPGDYDLTATVANMGAFSRKGLSIKGGDAVNLKITLPFNTQLGTLGEDRLAAAFNLSLHKPPAGPTPRTKDGKPDLSGVWWTPRVVDGGGPQFLAAAESVARSRAENNRKDSPQSRCQPSAVVRLGPLFQYVQSADHLVIISDDDSPGFHVVYLSEGHPADPNPSWYGHNAARWDGDTLVIDRVAFTERVWLDQDSHPHSEKLHVVDRIRRPDLGHLEMETTVEDAGVLAKPFTMKRVADLAAGHHIDEFICTENERDVAHMVGK